MVCAFDEGKERPACSFAQSDQSPALHFMEYTCHFFLIMSLLICLAFCMPGKWPFFFDLLFFLNNVIKNKSLSLHLGLKVFAFQKRAYSSFKDR